MSVFWFVWRHRSRTCCLPLRQLAHPFGSLGYSLWCSIARAARLTRYPVRPVGRSVTHIRWLLRWAMQPLGGFGCSRSSGLCAVPEMEGTCSRDLSGGALHRVGVWSVVGRTPRSSSLRAWPGILLNCREVDVVDGETRSRRPPSLACPPPPADPLCLPNEMPQHFSTPQISVALQLRPGLPQYPPHDSCRF